MLTTPILFIVFNRPDVTFKVFEAIKEARPTKLYIAADGPRKEKKGEEVLCNKVREITKIIDWDCEVKTLFRNENLGCKNAVSSAIDWFFSNEEEGIILEDDCLPAQDFFNYCAELLEKYRHNNDVMHIAGANFQKGNLRGEGSYYFSKYNHIWGWASWRRAWELYDVNMKGYNEKDFINILKHQFDTKKEINFWIKIFKQVIQGFYNTWDYQWTYAIWKKNGVAIIPNVNLISNIGFGSGTHTQAADVLGLSNMKTGELKKLVHPSTIIIDKHADKFALDHYFAPSLVRLYIAKIKALLYLSKT